MKKEAKVFVRDGIPWINPVCPCCERPLYEKPKFCPHCGTSHDRDFNAAINILAEGNRILAAGTAVKGAETLVAVREAHRL